ncbi:EAL domain-containing protein [Paenibacillus senegalensis]|uniref:EAL domain-containing protein n=1 Tax=Paenibacillus senegalensis TaxID=1465766 RepID=UPI000288A18E|nr:EAL domain-containing protein [Paenibacillus senegalensis]
MLFYLMVAFAVVPVILGVAMVITFGQTRLAKSFFVSLLFMGFWQLDVAFLYSYDLLPPELIEGLFRAFRFGSVLLGPAAFYIIYVLYHDWEGPKQKSGAAYRYIFSRPTLVAFYGFGILVYLLGWTPHGIKDLHWVEHANHVNYFYPTTGSWHELFYVVMLLFFATLAIGLDISRKVVNPHIRSFLIVFCIASSLACGIGMFNFSGKYGLQFSGLSVVIFAVTIFIAFIRMHTRMIRDINAELLSQKNFLRKLIDMDPNLIFTKDEKGRFTLVNTAAAQLFGKTPEEMIGRLEKELRDDLLEVNTSLVTEDPDAWLNLQENEYEQEELFVDIQGSSKWLKVSKIPIVTAKGRQLLCIASDITDYKRFHEQISNLAYHDSLTGLPNRLLFQDRLAEALQSAKPGRLAVLFLDLDSFKLINDSYSHMTGDTLLKLVADRLLGCLQPSDTVARRGGDEFSILLENKSRQEVKKVALSILEAFDKPFQLNGVELYISTSIGISVYPEDGKDVERLIKNADTAMYHSKERGKNHYTFYSMDMNQPNLRQNLLKEDLLRLLADADYRQFDLFYQPQISLAGRNLTGLEVLLRWRHPELGIISPNEFMAIAEENELFLPLGYWVLRTACLQCRAWRERGYRGLRLGINLSTAHLHDDYLPELVQEVLCETGMRPSDVELEMKEQVVREEQGLLLPKLRKIKEAGFQLKLENLPEGNSPLAYLNPILIKRIKLGQSIVYRMEEDAQYREQVHQLIATAHYRQWKVVAEGVESKDQLEMLENSGCDEVQGFLFGKPMTAKQFEESGLMGNPRPMKWAKE